VHAAVSPEGLPLCIVTGPGNEHDSERFEQVLERIMINIGIGRPGTKPQEAYARQTYQLFSSLVRQHLFFSLYRAFIESLASENATRLLSMQMAEKNIEEHMSELEVQLHRERQAGITSVACRF